MSGYQVANPVAQPASPLPVGLALKQIVKELEGCQDEEELTMIQRKVNELMNRAVIPADLKAQDPADRLQVIASMCNTAEALREIGMPEEAERIEEVVGLLESLPGMSPKKQRKALRKILRLTGKSVGVNVGNTGLCGYSLCCNAACVSGTAVLLGCVAGGLAALVILASTGELDVADNPLEKPEANHISGAEGDSEPLSGRAASLLEGRTEDASELENVLQLLNHLELDDRGFPTTEESQIAYDAIVRSLGSLSDYYMMNGGGVTRDLVGDYDGYPLLNDLTEDKANQLGSLLKFMDETASTARKFPEDATFDEYNKFAISIRQGVSEHLNDLTDGAYAN